MLVLGFAQSCEQTSSIPVASFDMHFAEVHLASSAAGEALVSSTAFDDFPTPDHLKIVEENI